MKIPRAARSGNAPKLITQARLTAGFNFTTKKDWKIQSFQSGRGSQTRTDTGVNPQDFESSASTSSAIPPSDNTEINIIKISSRQ